jgi:two-component system chemotaxis response regulator CheY
MAPLKILVVDDSVLAIRKLEAIFAILGHRVVKTANCGAAALEAYKESNPDLVTMDITMPDMDGIEVTKTLTASFPDARIIMITSHGQEGMVRKAIKAGAMGYLLKPVRADRLKDLIDKILRDS